MRLFILGATIGTLAVLAMAGSPGPAIADKSRMGCDTETEVWDAALGKCQPGTPKYKRRAAEPVKVEAPKKAAAPKKASPPKKAAAAKKAPADKAPAAK